MSDSRQPARAAHAARTPDAAAAGARCALGRPYVLEVRLAARPRQAAALEDLLSEAAVHLAANRACWVFIVGRSRTDEDVISLSEAWTSREAHDAALLDPRVQGFIERALPLLAEPPETTELGPVAAEELREGAAPR